MIKVVQIQYSPESGARSALRLQNALIKNGVQSQIVSLQTGTSNSSNITYLGKKQKLLARIDEKLQAILLRKRNKKYGLFSYPLLGSDISGLDEIRNADIIYIHWALLGFLNFNSIKQIARLNKPVIIFLHDMWSITGGCHYSFECEKYKTGCHNCQVFPRDNENDLSAKEFKKKARLYATFKNFYFVSPSKWLYHCAKESALTRDKPVFHIPNLLDETVYKPFDKMIAKRLLNINKTDIVIAFGAIAVNSPYKGWSYLQTALELLKQDNLYKNITVLVFGAAQNKEITDAIPFNTKFMGYLHDEYSAMLVYNAADVFIAPSLAEAFGCVVMEALCCGTPVVGFNIGGIPDIIKHKENGYLAKYKDAEDLAAGVKYCIEHETKGYLLPQLDTALTVQKHIDLYDHIKKQQPFNQ